MTKQGPIYAGGIALLQGALLLSGCGGPDLSETNDATPVNVATDATPIPAGSQAPVAGPERLVLAFGDSLYAGYGLGRGDSLPDDLQDALRADGINARVVNAGISGDTSIKPIPHPATLRCMVSCPLFEADSTPSRQQPR